MTPSECRKMVWEGLDIVSASLEDHLLPLVRQKNGGKVPRDLSSRGSAGLDHGKVLYHLIEMRNETPYPFPDVRATGYAHQVRQARNDVAHGGMETIEKAELALLAMSELLSAIGDKPRSAAVLALRSRMTTGGASANPAPGVRAAAAPASRSPEERKAPQGFDWRVHLRASVESAVAKLSVAEVEEGLERGWTTDLQRPLAKAIHDYVRSGRPILRLNDPKLWLEAFDYPANIRRTELLAGISVRQASGRITCSFRVGKDSEGLFRPAIRYKVDIAEVTRLLYVARYDLLRQASNTSKLDEFVRTWEAEERSLHGLLASAVLFFSRDSEKFVESQKDRKIALEMEAVRVYDDGNPKVLTKEESDRVATLIEAVPTPVWKTRQFLSQSC